LVQDIAEDQNMITAQYVNMQTPAQQPMLPLHFDAALMQFRKALSDEKSAEDLAS
jgi:hypothetical protein